ncbi:hypothetical protein [Coxiella endosymbiont of Ornithodoros amblus]|nr:hypothetical protein [Coxiella endosymbiont of Ornithodoros amblus]
MGGFAFAGGTDYSIWKRCCQPEEKEKSLPTQGEDLPELFY